MEEKKRLIYPDALRIISIFAVIVLHAVGELWGLIPIQSKSWVTLTIIDSLFRFAVPVFVMVSGAFMLSPEKNRGIKDLYSKNILRIVTSFIFWSLIYLVYHQTSDYLADKSSYEFDFKAILNSFLAGEYHLWFMYMIVGLYVATPIIRKLVEKKSTIHYFLMIWFAFCLGVNFIKLIPNVGSYAYTTLGLFKISVAVEFSGYYVLGYYLHNYEIKKPIKILTYVLAALGTIGMALVTVYTSFKSDQNVTKYFDYLIPTTAIQSIAVFFFVQSIFKRKVFLPKTQKAIYILSKISFGVYLSHLIIMKIIKKVFMSHFSLPTYALFGLLIISTLIISPLLSYLLNKIPGLKKYIV